MWGAYNFKVKCVRRCLHHFLIIIIFHNFNLLQDCELLYLSDRPEKLIMTNIAVPPVPIRPSVFMGGCQRSFSIYFSVFIFLAIWSSIFKLDFPL